MSSTWDITRVLYGLVVAKPRQAKVLSKGGELREAQFDAPCVLAIPAFDRIAGLNNRHLNYNGNMLTLRI